MLRISWFSKKKDRFQTKEISTDFNISSLQIGFLEVSLVCGKLSRSWWIGRGLFSTLSYILFATSNFRRNGRAILDTTGSQVVWVDLIESEINRIVSFNWTSTFLVWGLIPDRCIIFCNKVNNSSAAVRSFIICTPRRSS